MKRVRHLLIVAAFLALLLLPIYEAQGQDYVEYNVRINDDGSAAWRIVQVSDINAPVDSWTGFQQRILDLVDSAASVSHREMSLDFDSLQIDTETSAESKTTEYVFNWLNFSIIQNQLITFGDVFSVENFFGQLYGDAALKITYPPNFAVKSVSPELNERDNQTQTLVWFRTQDFVSGNPSIVLTSGSGGDWLLYLAVSIVTVAVGVSIASFFVFRKRKSNAKAATTASLTATSLVETDEDKIIKIIKSAGGTMRQSVITEQTRFSKAKTSQLLTALEQKGVVTRHKKGRDKIVSFNSKR